MTGLYLLRHPLGLSPLPRSELRPADWLEEPLPAQSIHFWNGWQRAVFRILVNEANPEGVEELSRAFGG